MGTKKPPIFVKGKKKDIHVEDYSELFFFLPGLYFSFFQQSGSGWLYSTTEQYPCTLFNLGVLN